MPAISEVDTIVITSGVNGSFLHATSYEGSASIVATISPSQREVLISQLESTYPLGSPVTAAEQKEQLRIIKLFIPTLQTGKIPNDRESLKLMKKLGCTPADIPSSIAHYFNRMLDNSGGK